MSLWSFGAVELASRIRSGEISVREVVKSHLSRIDEVNGSINAIVTLVAEPALEAASRADEAHAAGSTLGPLHGIPVAHKDLIDTAGIRTTYGSPLFADHVPEVDGLIVSRARAAGAITIGKTNTPEFGAGSHTFNPVFGVTRNPHAPDMSAGGSSGGAAAALASGMVPLADGSDLGGSLRNPASFCGVVGLRPSPGRVPSWPTPMPWQSMSVEGPMGRSVADVALLLAALAGPDRRVPISLDDAGEVFGPPLEAASTRWPAPRLQSQPRWPAGRWCGGGRDQTGGRPHRRLRSHRHRGRSAAGRCRPGVRDASRLVDGGRPGRSLRPGR